MTTLDASSSSLKVPSMVKKLSPIFGALIFAIFFWVIISHIVESQPTSLIVDKQGLTTTQYHELSSALSEQKIKSFFGADLMSLKQIVMQQDWVSQVNIERQWGKGIIVTVLPRQPIAKFGSNAYMDTQGVIFQANDFNDDLTKLPILQAPPSQSALVMQQMQQVNVWFAPLDLHVVDMVLTPRMTWVIRFDSGPRIIVDNEQTSQKLQNLSHLLQNQLREKIADIASVDLRYKNGLAIAWHDSYSVSEVTVD